MLLTSATALAWLIAYGYYVIFPLMVVEGPIITVLASFAASLGYLNVFVVFGVAVLGDLVGDALYYAIGLWGGRPLVERWGRKSGMTMERLRQAEHFMSKHSGKTLITAKITHGLGMWVLLGAGATRVPFGPFLWYNFLGTVPKAAIFVILGYFFGRAYDQLGQGIDTFSIVMAVIVLVAALVAWLWNRRKQTST